MRLTKRKISLAVSIALSACASAALAQTTPTLLGGGSTLVQPLVNAEIASFAAADGSLRYFAVGSGAGEAGFLNNDSSQFNQPVGLTVDLAFSDAPLSPFQLSTYAAGRAHTDGPLIQMPYLVTPITIPLVNAPTGTGPAFTGSTTPTVALNDQDLCGIFSGSITSWDNVTNPDSATGAKYTGGGNITVVYQSDNSGTTDLLTAHLAKVCPVFGITMFSETQGFTGLFPSGRPPANFVAASGDGGVAAQLVVYKSTTTTHAIAYLSPALTNTFLAPLSAPARTAALSVASLRNSHLPPASGNTNDVLPTFSNATFAIGFVAMPTNPADQSQWVPNASDPTAGYPISGTSQIIVSQCYKDAGTTPTVAASLIDFLVVHFNSNAAVLNGNGFDVVPPNLQTALKGNFLTNSSGNRLNIGNKFIVCPNVAGR